MRVTATDAVWFIERRPGATDLMRATNGIYYTPPHFVTQLAAMSLLTANRKPLTTTQMVSAVVTRWAERQRNRGAAKGVFVLDGAKVSDDEVGNPAVLLPVLVWHAENHFRYGVSSLGLGADYLEDDEALLKRTVDLNRATRGHSDILLFVIEAAEDARQNLPACAGVPGAVELRPLVNKFTEAFGIQSTPLVDVDGPAAAVKPWA